MPENKVLCGGQDCGVLRKNFPLKVFPSLDYQQRIPNYSRNSPPVVDLFILQRTGLSLRLRSRAQNDKYARARSAPATVTPHISHLQFLDENEKIDIVRHCDTLTLSCQVT